MNCTVQILHSSTGWCCFAQNLKIAQERQSLIGWYILFDASGISSHTVTLLSCAFAWETALYETSYTKSTYRIKTTMYLIMVCFVLYRKKKGGWGSFMQHNFIETLEATSIYKQENGSSLNIKSFLLEPKWQKRTEKGDYLPRIGPAVAGAFF